MVLVECEWMLLVGWELTVSSGRDYYDMMLLVSGDGWE